MRAESAADFHRRQVRPGDVNRQVGLREVHLPDRPQSIFQRELAEAKCRARDVHGVAPHGSTAPFRAARACGFPRPTPLPAPAGRGIVPNRGFAVNSD